MNRLMEFDYFYGAEAEQFSFIKLPKLLFTDRHFTGLSFEAKVVYGILLDRMSLSVKNDWIDENNRVYISFTVSSLAEEIGCSRDKAGKILSELDDSKGIGLVERKRRGLGKPDIIYVKNFVKIMENSDGDRDDCPSAPKPLENAQKDRLLSKLAKQFLSVQIIFIRRENNTKADKLGRKRMILDIPVDVYNKLVRQCDRIRELEKRLEVKDR